MISLQLLLMNKLLVIILAILGFISYSTNAFSQSSSNTLDTSSNASIMAWIQDLYAPGVTVTDDSILISEEAQRLLEDTTYRSLIYPRVYTWEPVVKFIETQDLKHAFWYMINLYSISDTYKNLVVKSILAYDSIFKMNKVLPNTFATYSLLDPEIGSFNEGHSEVTAPHILEKKLQVVKELLYYLEKNRSLNKK